MRLVREFFWLHYWQPLVFRCLAYELAGTIGNRLDAQFAYSYVVMPHESR